MITYRFFTLVLVCALGINYAYAQNSVTRGSLNVSASGAMQYSIPIQVPAGTNGLQPDLVFVYDGRTGDIGYGAGWAVSGFSMITRCNKTIAQDGVRAGVKFVMEDAYCLDGQRLIPVKGSNGAEGTEYRTETETFAKVISQGSYDRRQEGHSHL